MYVSEKDVRRRVSPCGVYTRLSGFRFHAVMAFGKMLIYLNGIPLVSAPIIHMQFPLAPVFEPHPLLMEW